jgi:hypothetical protein
MERELDVDEPVDERSAKTSCCGLLLPVAAAIDFCGLGGADELQRSANESRFCMEPANDEAAVARDQQMNTCN